MVNKGFADYADHFPFIGVAVWVAIILSIFASPARLGSASAIRPRLSVLAGPRALRFPDAGRKIAPGFVAKRRSVWGFFLLSSTIFR